MIGSSGRKAPNHHSNPLAWRYAKHAAKGRCHVSVSRAVALLLENRVFTTPELLSGININPSIIESLSGLKKGILAAANDDTPVVQLK
ncbi:MAG: hypothetical protein WAK55_11440 [Xanthobacteraceae bacterium]